MALTPAHPAAGPGDRAGQGHRGRAGRTRMCEVYLAHAYLADYLQQALAENLHHRSQAEGHLLNHR